MNTTRKPPETEATEKEALLAKLHAKWLEADGVPSIMEDTPPSCIITGKKLKITLVGLHPKNNKFYGMIEQGKFPAKVGIFETSIIGIDLLEQELTPIEYEEKKPKQLIYQLYMKAVEARDAEAEAES